MRIDINKKCLIIYTQLSMAAQESNGDRRRFRRLPLPDINRRTALLVGGGLGIAAAPVAGLVAGREIEKHTQPDYFTTEGSNVGVMYINTPTSQQYGEQLSFRGQLRTDARNLIPHITPPVLGKDTVQGLKDDQKQPVVDRQLIAEFMLLAAEIQYGINGRKVIIDAITKRGLTIRFAGQQLPPVPDGQPQPLVITLDKQEEVANEQVIGILSKYRMGDFQLPYKANEKVREIVKKTAAGIVASNSYDAQLVNVGDVAAATGLVWAATKPLARNATDEQVSRRGLFRWARRGAIATALVGTGLLVERYGTGQAQAAWVNQRAVAGSDLGSGYDRPSETFEPLLKSDFFKEEFRTPEGDGRFIKPTNPRQITS